MRPTQAPVRPRDGDRLNGLAWNRTRDSYLAGAALHCAFFAMSSERNLASTARRALAHGTGAVQELRHLQGRAIFAGVELRSTPLDPPDLAYQSSPPTTSTNGSRATLVIHGNYDRNVELPETIGLINLFVAIDHFKERRLIRESARVTQPQGDEWTGGRVRRPIPGPASTALDWSMGSR